MSYVDYLDNVFPEEPPPKPKTRKEIEDAILADEGTSGNRSPLRDELHALLSGGAGASPNVEQPLVQEGTPNLPPERTQQDINAPAFNYKPFAHGGQVQEPRVDSPEGIDQTALGRSTRGVRQTIAAGLGTTAQLPYMAAAAVPAGGLLLDRLMGKPDTPETVQHLQDTTGAAQRVGNWWNEALGVGGEPQNPVEKGARIVGESIMPAGKMTIPLTAGVAAVKGGMELMKPTPSEALPTQPKAIMPPSAFDIATMGDPAGAQHDYLVSIESTGGPTRVATGELATLGGMVLGSIGMIYAPSLFSKFKTGFLPKLVGTRAVENAVPGTITNSSWIDYARTTGDDVNAGILRIARKAGMDPRVLDSVGETFQLQTRGAAQKVAQSAVMHGRAETPTFTFQSKVPLSELAQADSPAVRDYLHARDTLDEILIQQAKPGTKAGPTTIRGLDEAGALARIGALERANPEVRVIGDAWRDITKNIRKFETTGEYGTMSRKKMNELNSTRPNEVPFEGPPVYDDPTFDRGNPFEVRGQDMVTRLRARMENEARGQYIDQMNRYAPDFFKRVASNEKAAEAYFKKTGQSIPNLVDNAHYKSNTITMWRRGKMEHYTADPLLVDTLRMDPYYFNGAINGVFNIKRMLEVGSTGWLAPWFATTSMLRSWQIAKYTADTAGAGLKSPGLFKTLAAIPQQLYPQLAKAISSGLDRGSGSWLSQVLPSGAMQSLSMRLAREYDNSLYAQLQTVGTHAGSILQQQVQAQNSIRGAIAGITNPAALDTMKGLAKLLDIAVKRPYMNTLSSMHNAASYAFVRKNLGKLPLPEMGMHARHLTGDPQVGGEFYTQGFSGPNRIRIAPDPSVTHTLGIRAAQGYGVASEIGRTAVPWFNYTQQGMKRIGEAYLANPMKFTMRMWAYGAIPSAALYLHSRTQGPEYVDYMMNRRSEYQKHMNWYLAVPGQPPEKGIEIPMFHEMTLFNRLMMVGMDHAFNSAMFSQTEDFKAALHSFLGIAILPPAPSVYNASLASQGLIGSQGPWEEAYKKREVIPFDQTGGMPGSIEAYIRALGGGVADVVANGYAAYTQTPDGIAEGLKNAAKEGGKRALSKAPIIRNLTGLEPPAAGNTRVTEEMFKKEKAINKLVEFFNKNEGEGDFPTTKNGQVEKSKGGGQIAEDLLKGAGITTAVPTQRAGLDQPKPTNPIYEMFMQRMYDRFRKDAPPDGAGFGSLMKKYGLVTNQLKTLRNINAGNFVTWQKQLSQRPEQLKFLEKAGVNPKDVTEVKNLYENIRQQSARVILNQIKAVEEEFSKDLGQPIKIEDLDPYGKGLGSDNPEMPNQD